MTENKSEHTGRKISMYLEDDCLRIIGLKGGTSIKIKWEEVTVCKGTDEDFCINITAEDL